jgi:hypothetical protein
VEHLGLYLSYVLGDIVQLEMAIIVVAVLIMRIVARLMKF